MKRIQNQPERSLRFETGSINGFQVPAFWESLKCAEKGAKSEKERGEQDRDPSDDIGTRRRLSHGWNNV
jgi:hypothetical protein